LFVFHRLHTGRVKHDASLSSDSLWGQVSVESATNDTIGSVSSAHLSPVDAELVAVFVSSGSLGDERNLLSVVEFSSLLGVNALDLEQRNVIVLVTETSLEAEDSGIAMKTDRSLWGNL
jgi:hypothetical protein